MWVSSQHLKALVKQSNPPVLQVHGFLGKNCSTLVQLCIHVWGPEKGTWQTKCDKSDSNFYGTREPYLPEIWQKRVRLKAREQIHSYLNCNFICFCFLCLNLLIIICLKKIWWCWGRIRKQTIVQNISHSSYIWKVSFLAANMKREHNLLISWELLKRHGAKLQAFLQGKHSATTRNSFIIMLVWHQEEEVYFGNKH